MPRPVCDVRTGPSFSPAKMSRCLVDGSRSMIARRSAKRSEEHTSELQSLMRISYAVFCLKKKKKQHYISNTQIKQTTEPNRQYTHKTKLQHLNRLRSD